MIFVNMIVREIRLIRVGDEASKGLVCDGRGCDCQGSFGRTDAWPSLCTVHHQFLNAGQPVASRFWGSFQAMMRMPQPVKVGCGKGLLLLKGRSSELVMLCRCLQDVLGVTYMRAASEEVATCPTCHDCTPCLYSSFSKDLF